MNTKIIIAVIVAVVAFEITFFLYVINHLKPEPEVRVISQTEYVCLKDLPRVEFNWTPINERTEKPEPLPTIKFNQIK